MPWPMNSWLPSSAWPWRTASARLMATASIEASIVITRHGANRRRRVSIDRSGIDSAGKAPGSGGTLRRAGRCGMACWTSCATSVPATTPTSIAGIRRFNGAHSLTITIVISATAIGRNCH